MRKLLLLLIPIFASCSFDKASVEFDRNQNTITVLSDNYKITNILINEIENGKQLDSTFSSIDLEKPASKVDLLNVQNAQFYGKPMSELLAKKNLMYKIALQKSGENQKPGFALIHFETKNIDSDSQIFSEP